jgi:hypothetical protein
MRGGGPYPVVAEVTHRQLALMGGMQNAAAV